MNILNIISSLVILLIFSSLQSEYNSFEVETNFYSKKNIDTFEIRKFTNKLDMDFYRLHFDVLKDVWYDKTNFENRNSEIQIGEFQNSKITPVQLNKYDSIGRLIEYKSLGCSLCADFPSGYRIVYDNKNNIIQKSFHSINQKIEDIYVENSILKSKAELNDVERKKINIKYDNNDNIIQVEIFEFDKLVKKIKLID